MLFFFIISFLTGVITKYSDHLADEVKKNTLAIGIILSLIYGIFVGYLMAADARFLVLILGIILGNIFSKKIDHLNHQIAFVPIILIVALSGLPANILLYLPLTIVFFIAAYLDEQLNSNKKARKALKKKLGRIYLIAKYRLVLEVATLIVSVVLWDPTFSLLLISFDLGYILLAKVASKNLK